MAVKTKEKEQDEIFNPYEPADDIDEKSPMWQKMDEETGRLAKGDKAMNEQISPDVQQRLDEKAEWLAGELGVDKNKVQYRPYPDPTKENEQGWIFEYRSGAVSDYLEITDKTGIENVMKPSPSEWYAKLTSIKTYDDKTVNAEIDEIGENLEKEANKEAAREIEAEKEIAKAEKEGKEVIVGDYGTYPKDMPQKDILKQEIAGLKKDLDELYGKLCNETSIARAQGMSEEDKEKIDKLGDDIRKTTLKLKEKQSIYRDRVKATAKEAVSTKIKGLGNVFRHMGDKLIQSGKNALAKMTDGMYKTNVKALTLGKSAYREASFNMTQVYRDWQHTNYSLERGQAKILDTMQKNFSKQYLKNAERSAAARNIGRNIKTLFTGKKHEQVQARTTLTEPQMKYIAAIQKTRDEILADAEGHLEKYNRSAENQIKAYTKDIFQREEAGIKSPNRNFQDDIDYINRKMKHDKDVRDKDVQKRGDIFKGAKKKDDANIDIGD